jgi:hypothetical protein
MPRAKKTKKATKEKIDKKGCEWISRADAFRRFAGHKGGTQSAQHIKPLHWYIACRLVLEGGFDPEHIRPHPPFVVTPGTRKTGPRLSYDPSKGDFAEEVVLGGLKTKNVDVVVTNPRLGPVMAISCKGVTKAFRNLTNRMEETIGECTNLHITYPALVLGYFAVLRANRTLKDALEAPDDPDEVEEDDGSGAPDLEKLAPSLIGDDASAVVSDGTSDIEANDIAILKDGSPAYGIVRFHNALWPAPGSVDTRLS